MKNDDDLEYENQNCPETEYIIDPINKNKKDLMYGLYTQLSALSSFYNRVQNSFKTVVKIWLLATLIAMQYLFSISTTKLPFPPTIILICILLAGMWGITLVWFLDIYIYQTYFYSVISEQMKLENKAKWLSKINTFIAKTQIHKKNRISQSFFYIRCQYILLIFMDVLCISLFNYKIISSILITVFFIFVAYIIRFVMLRIEHPKKESPLKKDIRKKLKTF